MNKFYVYFRKQRVSPIISWTWQKKPPKYFGSYKRIYLTYDRYYIT